MSLMGTAMSYPEILQPIAAYRPITGETEMRNPRFCDKCLGVGFFYNAFESLDCPNCSGSGLKPASEMKLDQTSDQTKTTTSRKTFLNVEGSLLVRTVYEDGTTNVTFRELDADNRRTNVRTLARKRAHIIGGPEGRGPGEPRVEMMWLLYIEIGTKLPPQLVPGLLALHREELARVRAEV